VVQGQHVGWSSARCPSGQTGTEVKFLGKLPMSQSREGTRNVDGFAQEQALEFSSPSRSAVREENQPPVRFVVDPKRRLVIASFGQRLTAAEIQSYAQNLCNHPKFDPSFSEIADISNVKELPIEGPDFLKLADRIDPFSLESKRAFVAQTSLQKHAARIHKILRGQRNFRIFEKLEEAECWIRS